MDPTSTMRLMRLLSALAVFAALTGCSTGGSGDAIDQVSRQTRSLGAALSDAVDAAHEAQIGFGDESSKNRAISAADAEARRLSDTVEGLGDPNLRLLAQEVVNVAKGVVAELRLGDVTAAAHLRSERFVPVASQLTALRPAGVPEDTDTRSQSPDLMVPVTVIVLVVLAVAVYLARRARYRLDAPQATGRDSQAERNATRAWDEPHPLYAGGSAVAAPSAGMETRRTGMMRAVDFDLRTLLETTIEQLHEHEWEVALVCPPVHISGDPIRLQRVLAAAVGAAKLRGADQVGLAVEVADGEVLLTIGDDAPAESLGAVAEVAERLARQVGSALGIDEAEISWIADDEVTLFTVSLARTADTLGASTG